MCKTFSKLIVYGSMCFYIPFRGGDMLVPVEYKGVSTWVRVPKTGDVYNYSEFVQEGKMSVIY